MKAPRGVKSALDSREIVDLEVSYEHDASGWHIVIGVFRAGMDEGFTRSWPVTKAMVHYQQLDDIGLWAGSAISDAICSLLTVKGLPPGK